MNEERRKNSIVLGLLCLGWVVGFWLLFASQISDLWRQWKALEFATAPGQITVSELITEEVHEEEGGCYYAYSARLHFKYRVGGIEYKGDRFSFASEPSGRFARTNVIAHPVGSQVTVYYNPASPTEAVLRPGLWGGDLMRLQWLMGYTLLGYGLCLAVWSMRPIKSLLPPQVELTRQPWGARVRLPMFGKPLDAGIAMLALATIIFALVPHEHTRANELLVLECEFVAASIAFLLQLKRIVRGHYYLLLNSDKQQLTIPPAATHGPAMTISFDQIVAIQEARVETPNEDTPPTVRHQTTLQHTAGTATKEIILAQFIDESAASAFTNWLRDQLTPAPPRKARPSLQRERALI